MSEVYIVTVTPYPGRGTVMKDCFTERARADQAFDAAAASGRSRARLWACPVADGANASAVAVAWYQARCQAPAGPGFTSRQRPLRDTAALVTLDSSQPLRDVFNALTAALDAADPTGWRGEVSEINPVPVRNAVRAAGLRYGLIAYANQVGNAREDTRTVIQDLLTDLHHLATLFGPDDTLGDLVQEAARHFDAELHGQ